MAEASIGLSAQLQKSAGLSNPFLRRQIMEGQEVHGKQFRYMGILKAVGDIIFDKTVSQGKIICSILSVWTLLKTYQNSAIREITN